MQIFPRLVACSGFMMTAFGTGTRAPGQSSERMAEQYIMNCWPVVIREISTESRRPFNSWLRLLGVGAITLVFVVSLLDQSETAANLGARLFGRCRSC